MDARQVAEVLAALRQAGILAVVDGGWGVDALWGRATREHRDVDLIISLSDLARAESSLRERGFRRVQSTPGVPSRAVLETLDGQHVDFHLVRYDAKGNGWQELEGTEPGGRGWFIYPAAELAAEGMIDGRAVQCISAWLQIHHHAGYVWKPQDEHDIRLLHRAFGTPLPPG